MTLKFGLANNTILNEGNDIDSHDFTYTILQLFPFTSESKRMGIIIKVNLLMIKR